MFAARARGTTSGRGWERLDAEDADRGKVGAERVEIGEVRGVDDVTAAGCRCHHDRIDGGCSSDRGQRFTCKLRKGEIHRFDA